MSLWTLFFGPDLTEKALSLRELPSKLPKKCSLSPYFFGGRCLECQCVVPGWDVPPKKNADFPFFSDQVMGCVGNTIFVSV